MQEVTPTPVKDTVNRSPITPGGKEGAIVLGFTPKQIEFMDMLEQPGVRTYAAAAARLGITEGAGKQRMSRAHMQVIRARGLINEWERRKKARREARKGKYQVQS